VRGAGGVPAACRTVSRRVEAPAKTPNNIASQLTRNLHAWPVLHACMYAVMSCCLFSFSFKQRSVLHSNAYVHMFILCIRVVRSLNNIFCVYIHCVHTHTIYINRSTFFLKGVSNYLWIDSMCSNLSKIFYKYNPVDSCSTNPKVRTNV